MPLKQLGLPIIGTDPATLTSSKHRKLFGKLLDELGIPSPPNGTATSVEQACELPTASASLFSSAPATSWAVAPW